LIASLTKTHRAHDTQEHARRHGGNSKVRPPLVAACAPPPQMKILLRDFFTVTGRVTSSRYGLSHPDKHSDNRHVTRHYI